MSMQKHRRLFKVHAPARAASAFALSKAEVLDNLERTTLGVTDNLVDNEARYAL